MAPHWPRLPVTRSRRVRPTLARPSQSRWALAEHAERRIGPPKPALYGVGLACAPWPRGGSPSMDTAPGHPGLTHTVWASPTRVIGASQPSSLSASDPQGAPAHAALPRRSGPHSPRLPCTDLPLSRRSIYITMGFAGASERRLVCCRVGGWALQVLVSPPPTSVPSAAATSPAPAHATPARASPALTSHDPLAQVHFYLAMGFASASERLCCLVRGWASQVLAFPPPPMPPPPPVLEHSSVRGSALGPTPTNPPRR